MTTWLIHLREDTQTHLLTYCCDLLERWGQTARLTKPLQQGYLCSLRHRNCDLHIIATGIAITSVHRCRLSDSSIVISHSSIVADENICPDLLKFLHRHTRCAEPRKLNRLSHLLYSGTCIQMLLSWPRGYTHGTCRLAPEFLLLEMQRASMCTVYDLA